MTSFQETFLLGDITRNRLIVKSGWNIQDMKSTLIPKEPVSDTEVIPSSSVELKLSYVCYTWNKAYSRKYVLNRQMKNPLEKKSPFV